MARRPVPGERKGEPALEQSGMVRRAYSVSVKVTQEELHWGARLPEELLSSLHS